MKRFKSILLSAGTESNEAALNRAVRLALENNATLTLMDVVKPMPRSLGMFSSVPEPEELQQLIVADHREKILKIASEYIDTGVPIDIAVVTGDPATEVVRRVLREKHDLVIKTADGGSAIGRLFGSVACSLLRICPCPVWILKPEIHGAFDRVLAAIDLLAEDQAHTNLNRQILEIAVSVARLEDARLHIVGAWDLWMERALRRHSGEGEVDAMLASQEQRVRAALEALLRSAGTSSQDVEVHLHRGHAASIIRSVADTIEADLMVMGTVCRTGTAGFLIGNTAETVLADVTCSVLAMKPDGFVSPVEMANAGSNAAESKAAAPSPAAQRC
jgi:nucleotide-binding universal stress UspA family protein